MPRMPQGSYQFLIQSDGYAPYQWHQLINDKTHNTTLIAELKTAKLPTPIRPIFHQIGPNLPLKLISSDKQFRHQFTRLRIRCYRLVGNLNWRDPITQKLLLHIHNGSAAQHTLNSDRFLKVWERYLTRSDGTISYQFKGQTRQFKIQPLSEGIPDVWFADSGIYVIEISGATSSKLFDTIQYPILVSTYKVFRSENTQIQWVNQRTATFKDGNLYAASNVKGKLSIRRIASLAQYNHNPTSIPDANFLILRDASDQLSILPGRNFTQNKHLQEIRIIGDAIQSPTHSVLIDIDSNLERFKKQLIAKDSVISVYSETLEKAEYSPKQSSSSTGDVEVIFDKHVYTKGEEVLITVQSPIPVKTYIEFSKGLGSADKWVNIGASATHFKKSISPIFGAHYVKVTYLKDGHLKTIVQQIPLEPPTENSQQLIVDSRGISSTGKTVFTISLAGPTTNQATQVVLINGFYEGAQKSMDLGHLSDALNRTENFGPNKTFKLPFAVSGVEATTLTASDTKEVELSPPGKKGTIVLISLIKTIDSTVKQVVHQFPARPAINIDIDAPKFARPNDTVEIIAVISNDLSQGKKGVLTVKFDQQVISTQKVQLTGQQTIRLPISVKIPPFPKDIKTSIKVELDINKTREQSQTHIKVIPQHLPESASPFDTIEISDITPSESIRTWINQSQNPIFITGYSDLIRFILLQSQQLPTVFNPGQLAYQFIESEHLLKSNNQFMSSEIKTALKKRTERLTTLLNFWANTAVNDPSLIDVTALALLTNVTFDAPTLNQWIKNKFVYAVTTGPTSIDPMSNGFLAASFYLLYRLSSPEFTTTELNKYSHLAENKQFIRGAQLKVSPAVFGETKSIETPYEPIQGLNVDKYSPIERFERSIILSRKFKSLRFKYTIIRDGKVSKIKSAKIIDKIVPEEFVNLDTIRIDRQVPVILFREQQSLIVAPQIEASWRHVITPVLEIRLIPTTSVTSMTIYQPFGLILDQIIVDGQFASYTSDENKIYVKLPRYSQHVRLNFNATHRGKRSPSLAWIQTEMNRSYIRIPSLEI